MKKHVLLWCSPGFGLADVWLPVIKKLKEREGVMVDFVFPEPSSIRLENKNSGLYNLAEVFSDKIVFRGYSGRWFIADTLNEAQTSIKFNQADETILRLSARLKSGRLSKYYILREFGKYLLVVYRYVFYIKENFGSLNLYDFNLLKNTDGILYDVLVENKFVNKELRDGFRHVPKFSMRHGLDAGWICNEMLCKKQVKFRSDVVVYTMSKLESDGYKKCFGISENNIIHVGIPRHDKDWIEFIYNQSYSVKNNIFDSFVFIIGRPASQYNTPERKKKALKDIYEIVCNKYKLKLIVKTHPKESLDGVDGDIYRNALGIENYGKDWVFSDNHVFMLGKKAFFCISFYSGVIIDMLAINRPTIEYLNLEGLDAYDNSDSLRDEYGKPVFQYRYTNLVLGASSKSALDQHIDSILNQYEATILSLQSRYEEYFKPFNGASEMVANNIFNRINNKIEPE